MNHQVLENDRAELIPLSLSHLDQLWAVAEENPGLLEYSPSDITSKSKLKKYIEVALVERMAFMIIDKLNGEVAGCTSYGNISLPNSRVEIGWTWIGRKFQGTGLNGKVKQLMLGHAFEKSGIERVEFKIDARNMKSRKAVEKLGATYEGCLRSHTVMRDGFRRDTVYYSILKREWHTENELL